MKNLEYYMALPYKMEITPDPDEGGYVASFLDFPGCLTYADTLEELFLMAEDAKKTWLTAALEDGFPIEEPKQEERS